jgi:hypothetical protein
MSPLCRNEQITPTHTPQKSFATRCGAIATDVAKSLGFMRLSALHDVDAEPTRRRNSIDEMPKRRRPASEK